MLKVSAALATGIVMLCGASAGHTQKLDFLATGAPLKAAPVDKEIAAAIRAASPAKIHQNIETLVNFKNRMTTSSVETDLPAGTGILAAAEYIKGQFEAISKDCGGCLEVQEDVFMQPGSSAPGSRITKDTKLVNIYAILKGTDPAQSKRMYLVTGHYDTRVIDMTNTHDFAPGANDDTSGTAVSMECARILSKHKFPATIIFATVPGEEQGLNGSSHLAKLAKKEGWDLEGVLNNDIVGGNTTPGEIHQSKTRVRVFSESVPQNATVDEMKRLILYGNESDTPSRELAREVLDVSRTYFPAVGAAVPPTSIKPVMEMRLDRYGRGGDHRSFNEEGFAGVRFTEWREDYHHQHQDVRTEGGIEYGDLLKFDDFDYIAKVARVNAATLATMASAPGAPKSATMSARNQDNNSVMKFTVPDGAPNDTWYQVVWRETDASDWQYGAKSSLYDDKIEAATHTITVPISKDNVFFGIRSCDTKGHCSAAVAPAPEVPVRNGPRPARS
ncbi:M20/M25/M40 family metallo-hydrolase [soil metagenome]